MLQVLALLGMACDYGFKPATLVDNLRLLGVQASPADLRPGEQSAFTLLAPDPTNTPSTVLWLGCAPDPYDLNRSPCANADLLQDPGALVAGGQLPAGVSVIGFNDSVTYAAPAGLFDALPADDLRRQTGTVGQAIAFAVSETISPTASSAELQAVFDRVQRKETRAVLALYRLKVSENSQRNTNPVLSGLLVNGEALPEGATIALGPGTELSLDAIAPDSSFETYDAIAADGTRTSTTERVLVAWYSTSGRFSHERTALREAVTTTFTAPGGADPQDPVPTRRAGTLWAVARDTRGGQSWCTAPFFVCDGALPAVAITSVDWPTSIADPVVLHGTGLASVLDLIVDGQALQSGAYSPTNGTWRALLPPGVPAGAARGEVRTKRCERFPLP